jgi:hypothetical protein
MLPPSKRSAGLLLSAAVVSAIWLAGLAPVRAEDAPAAPAAPAAGEAPAAAAAPANEKLKQLAGDFLHYSIVNNVELTKANGQALLDANADPKEFLAAFEEYCKERNQDPLEYPREIMLRNQRRDEVRDISKKLLAKLEEGYRAVSRDPQRIRAEIERLDKGARAYQSAQERLVAAGQFAAPIYFEYLQNGDKKNLHPLIERIIVATGRPMVLPIVEELKIQDPGLRVELVGLLGQIGYRQSLPALRALQSDDKVDAESRRAAEQAIGQIDRSGAAAKESPTALYLEAAEAYYDKKPSYQPQLPDEKTNPIWEFDANLKNVNALAVPTPIWNSAMAARSAGQAIKLDPNNAKAISLWLAAELRKEIHLPQGETDPTREPNRDPAAIALASGPVYVNPVLSRALDAHDASLALKAIDVLEATGGNVGLVDGGNSPLIRALSYPDRAVRFRAAFALARANPANPFPSHFRVVPILAEAISSTGTPTALVVSPDEDKRNKIAETLRNAGTHYTVYSGPTLSAALEQGRRAPAFDVVVIANGAEVSRISDVAQSDYRLSGVPVLVAAPEASLPSVKVSLNDMKGYAPVNEAGDEATINAALSSARSESGNVPLDAEKASQFSVTAIKLLGDLAADHKSIYNVSDALPALTEALKDKRPEVATGAAGVLGKLVNADAEKALAAAALSTDIDAAVKGPTFLALAESAKRNGNVLDSAAINGIIKALNAEQDPNTRNAIATALGALNVPSNQAATLILQQVK